MTAYLRVTLCIPDSHQPPPHHEAQWRVFTGTGLVLVDVRQIVVAGGNVRVVLAQRLLSNHNGLLVQLNGFLKFPLPRTNTNKWGVKTSSTLSKAQVRYHKLKYAATSSSTLPKAQVRRGVLEKMTAYLK